MILTWLLRACCAVGLCAGLGFKRSLINSFAERWTRLSSRSCQASQQKNTFVGDFAPVSFVEFNPGCCSFPDHLLGILPSERRVTTEQNISDDTTDKQNEESAYRHFGHIDV